jgi:hypothetical protein
VWIKTDETLPWTEMQGEYRTKSEARRAARETLERTRVKIVELQVKAKLPKPRRP